MKATEAVDNYLYVIGKIKDVIEIYGDVEIKTVNGTELWYKWVDSWYYIVSI